MTRAEACKILGLSASPAPAKVEEAYRACQEAFQRRAAVAPSIAARHRAVDDLVQLKAAKECLANSPPKPPAKPRPRAPRQTQRAYAAPVPVRPVMPSLTDFFRVCPLPKSVVILCMILSFLMVASTVSSCLQSCVNTLAGEKRPATAAAVILLGATADTEPLPHGQGSCRPGLNPRRRM